MQLRNLVSSLFNTTPVKSLDPQKLYDQKIAEYDAMIADIEREQKRTVTALERHVISFLKADQMFDKHTVAHVLTGMRSSGADAKGSIIATFNATHGSSNHVCPALSAQFRKDKNAYARFLHLGTTRIWKADGIIDEVALKKFKEFFAKDQKEQKDQKEESIRIPVSKLKDYLSACLQNDAPETTNGSGRRADGFFGLSTQSMRIKTQAFAATAAWDEVFDRLACGKTDKGENYITMKIAEEFFRDSTRAFLRAVCGLLPVTPEVPQKSYESTYRLI